MIMEDAGSSALFHCMPIGSERCPCYQRYDRFWCCDHECVKVPCIASRNVNNHCLLYLSETTMTCCVLLRGLAVAILDKTAKQDPLTMKVIVSWQRNEEISTVFRATCTQSTVDDNYISFFEQSLQHLCGQQRTVQS